MDDLDERLDIPRQRGRQSAAARAVLPVDVKARPLPPPGRLTEEESSIWREVVASVKSGWFSGSEVLLETYCRAISDERRLASLLRQANPAEEGFGELMRLHKAAMLAVAHIAGRLRLTVRSLKAHDTVRGTVRGPKPWEFRSAASDDDDASSETSSPVEPS